MNGIFVINSEKAMDEYTLSQIRLQLRKINPCAETIVLPPGVTLSYLEGNFSPQQSEKNEQSPPSASPLGLSPLPRGTEGRFA